MHKRLAIIHMIIATVLISAAAFAPSPSHASNQTYAALPPFISADSKPNVVLVIDFSGSMQFQAYYGDNYSGYHSSRVAEAGSVSAHYDSSTSYYGYFDSAAYYKYDSTNGYWEKDPATSYSAHEPGDKDSLSGNLLNFIVTTRVDAVLKNLIGGKASCPADKGYCLLRPQGARRYITDSNLNATFYVRPQYYDNSGVAYANQDVLISVSNSSYYASSSIGTFSNRSARVKVDAEERTGIIQENFNKVRFSFIGYANSGNSDAMEGTIKYGAHEASMDHLINALETSLPYNGTGTGEAMRQAYYYLSQNSAYAYSYNKSYISPGTTIDPYYKLSSTGNLEPAWCRKSFVVLISDGEWNGSIDPAIWAKNLHVNDLRNDTTSFPNDQTADVFSLFAFSSDEQGLNSMQTIAAFGSYEDIDGCSDSTPYTLSTYNSSLNNSFPRNSCNPSGTYNSCCEEWDADDNDGVPDTFYYASNGEAMARALAKIFQRIQIGTASGTAVTALTSKVSSGNVIAQGAFYPEKEFEDSKTVNWTGDVFAEWYLNGYYANASGDSVLVQNIREDTNSNFTLDVVDDRILEYLIEDQSLTISAYDSTQYGTAVDDIADEVYLSIEDAANLFDCGEQLRTRKPSERTIYGVSETNDMIAFTAANADFFDAYLGTLSIEFPDCLLDSGTPKYADLINYTRGEEIGLCRSRVTNNETSIENVWKIGDIIYSSPTIVEYDDFSMIFAGSNSGMLHAFRLGYLKTYRSTLAPAKLCDDNDAATCTQKKTGKEEWAFIPKDALPYLRYMADPNYDHVYGVDLKPYIIDTGSRMILIGGMRMGGACDNGSINPPIDTAPVGRSAYFALDITDPLNPEYLWRYAPDGMGFSYSGPAYIKRRDSDGKWHYFILFASGPTDYKGHSTQNLQIFTVDLFTGEEKNVFGDKTSEKNIKNAFGGRLFTNGLDVNEDGQTDFVFLGITSNADGDFNKHKGGIIKIYTGSSDATQWVYTTNFLAFADNPITAPVKVMDCFPDELDFPFLYFATGRYFSSEDETQDGTNDYNRLYGVPFIYDENNARITGGSGISSASNSSVLTCDSLNAINTNPQQAAWYIDLDPASGNYYRERCYSDPTITDYDVVFFNTTKPISVACECGGQSRSWVLNCATGQSIYDILCDGDDEDATQYVVDPKIQFNYLVQLSGGDINQYGEDDFTEQNRRATGWTEGVNAENPGLPTFPPASTLGQILYWKQW